MRNKKLLISIVSAVLLVLILVFTFVIPTFSRFSNGNNSQEWDGLASGSFNRGTGTIEDPYIISNPNEFAYFALSLSNDDYENKYIKLTKDIVINKGVFKNNTYIDNDTTYYLGNDNKYYSEEELETEVGTLNVFPIIDGFKGHFDGDFHTIYGLYEKDNEKNALFTDFSGELKNLYIDNAYITGGYITAGVVADANNATIKNVLFNGNVVGNPLKREKLTPVTITDFIVEDTTTKTINMPIISNISENVLTGTCSGPSTFTLNNVEYTCDDFEIEVSNTFEIGVTTTATFTNVTYNLTYDENKTAGIVGLAYNTNLDGLVNKGKVSGAYTTGIVGTTLNSNIQNSYNKGRISGERSSGIVDTIMYSNSYIRSSYNDGELQATTKYGLSSNIYNSTISVDKTFNTQDVYMLNNINSTISVENSFNKQNYTTNDFSTLNIQTVNGLFPKYTDDTNIQNGNIWVGEEIPILYFDDIKNRTVQIKVGNTTWDSLKTNTTNIRYNDQISVLITTSDMYKPIKDVWYYASNEELSDFSNITWTTYNGIFQLNNNAYIVYVKYEDYDDNVYYINTDKLIVGTITSNVSIRNSNDSWNTYHTPINKYLNNNTTYQIVNNGGALSVSNIEYLISANTISQENLPSQEWTTYTNTITPSGNSYIIYAKVTSIDSTITYLNTDKMINMSYHVSNLKAGNNQTFTNYLRYNSSFNFDVSLTHSVQIPNYQRYIRVDKMLPNNTIITLKDTNNHYYEYKVSTHNYDNSLNSYLYPLSGFKKVGKVTFDEYFDDTDYDNTNSESFNIFIDFKNISSVSNNYNISLIAKDTEIVNTKYGEDITINLVNTNTNSLSISTTYNNSISYGVDSTNNISLTTTLTPVTQNNNTVIDTTLENQYEGLSIEVYDNQNSIVSRDNLKYIRFKYNNEIYTFDNNNKVNINLGTGHNKNINLQVLTYNSYTNLNGTYYIKIKGYLSLDGINRKTVSNNVISIPLVFTRTNNLNYSFDVSLQEPIINKGGSFSFDVTYTGDLDDPILKVSLYRKKRLTAYDQEYELVDLKNFVTNNIGNSNNSIYEINLDDIVFNIRNNVGSNGYKFVFELYDGNDKISENTIKAIIR